MKLNVMLVFGVPKKLSQKRCKKIIETIIRSGLDDAFSASEDPDMNNPDANIATDMTLIKINIEPKIVITVEGGIVQHVEKTNCDIPVFVHDYDVDHNDVTLTKDEHGDSFFQGEW